MPTVIDYTALLSGKYWNGIEVTGTPSIVTFSFPTMAPAYDAGVDGFTPATVASFQAFTTEEQAQTIAALNEWAAASGLVFIQVAPGQGDLNFQNVDFTTLSSPSSADGMAFYPFGDWNFASYPYFIGDSGSSGDVFMNWQYLSAGKIDYGTLLHEIGHAIGLKHPTEIVVDGAAQPSPVTHDQVLSADDPALTVMAQVGDGTPGDDVHLKALDKDAAAAIYGAAGTGGVYTDSASGANSVVSWSWDAATQTLTQTAVKDSVAIRGTPLHDAIVGSTGDDSLFGLGGGDSLYGGEGNDLLYDGDGADALFGGAGNDILYGGAGGNSVYGGLGNDSLYGGAGDTLEGGGGDDRYFVSGGVPTITEVAPSGYDIIFSDVSITLPDDVEELHLYGGGLTGTGNDEGISIYGDADLSNTLIGGAGNDYLVGGQGADTIEGLAGVNYLIGQGGADVFRFTKLADAPLGPNFTAIGDFADGQDKIDLSAIRVSGGPADGGPLSFIGTAAFNHVAGEVRQSGDAPSIIEGDVDGDGNADFQILLYGGHALQSSDFIFNPPCYVTGTRIRTTGGEIAVERLAVGDLVVTASGEARPVRWIGRRTVDCARHPRPQTVWPVRIRAGAIGPGAPARDLIVSPHHAIAIEGRLVKAIRLVNGVSVRQEETASVTYWHVELDSHDLLLAEGLAAESYLDCGNRRDFENGGAVLSLHPTFDADSYRDNTCLPFADAPDETAPLHAQVFARVAHRFVADAGVRVIADGVAIAPRYVNGRTFGFDLPAGARDVRLASRTVTIADVESRSRDRRCVGVLVRDIVADGAPVDIAALGEGWHEGVSERGERWTRGDAALPAGVRTLRLHAYALARYPLPEPTAVAVA